MKTVIFGASGSGTSTLAEALAERCGAAWIDADGLYWENHGRPFEFKKDPQERNGQLRKALDGAADVFVAGSVFSWDEAFFTAFDFAVFCYVPKDERMRRLEAREEQRYGQLLADDPWYRQQSADFLQWAAQYDEPEFPSRSLKLHEGWMARLGALGVPLLRLEGMESVVLRADRVLAAQGRDGVL